MPKIGEMIESKFLKKEDVNGETGSLVTITGLEQHNVSKDESDPQIKWCLIFEELDKPMVLNKTNIEACARACGSDDTDNWIGKRVVIYEDPNIQFAGKITGGIRLRAPRSQAAPVVPQKKAMPATPEDPLPF